VIIFEELRDKNKEIEDYSWRTIVSNFLATFANIFFKERE